MSDAPAVALARAHLEAWTTHDLDIVRGNLAEDVQFYSPAANLVGINNYMDAPRGLTQFARQVVPGSLRIIATAGDERNAHSVPTAARLDRRCLPAPRPGCWTRSERSRSSGSSLT